TFNGGSDMSTRRIFLRNSGIVMAGMGAVPSWLARAAALDGDKKKRKTLVAIFMRGAADGLNIVVPFGDKQYQKLRPTVGVGAPVATTSASRPAAGNNGQA